MFWGRFVKLSAVIFSMCISKVTRANTQLRTDTQNQLDLVAHNYRHQLHRALFHNMQWLNHRRLPGKVDAPQHNLLEKKKRAEARIEEREASKYKNVQSYSVWLQFRLSYQFIYPSIHLFIQCLFQRALCRCKYLLFYDYHVIQFWFQACIFESSSSVSSNQLLIQWFPSSFVFLSYHDFPLTRLLMILQKSNVTQLVVQWKL